MKPRNNSMSASQYIFLWECLHSRGRTKCPGQNVPNKMSTDEASPERKMDFTLMG